MRIGQGFDVHRFAEGRPMIIGGVSIPYEKGLLGHSDADVLLHALCDAILGALGRGDIGQHFPDTDNRYKEIDSRQLLAQVWEMARADGFALQNADMTIIAQKPKMAPHTAAMKRTIANILEAEEGRINIKATTSERLGFTGREEGIAAMAVVLLVNHDEKKAEGGI
jgi:2-C-methyl-D-erythritol 2,4-cyclodiphosphate synthase